MLDLFPRKRTYDLIAVFGQTTSDAAARTIASGLTSRYGRGMDDSKEADYLARTGPKLILTFETAAEREAARASLNDRSELVEAYIPGWEKLYDPEIDDSLNLSESE